LEPDLTGVVNIDCIDQINSHSSPLFPSLARSSACSL
jgi:hypothetical protein